MHLPFYQEATGQHVRIYLRHRLNGNSPLFQLRIGSTWLQLDGWLRGLGNGLLSARPQNGVVDRHGFQSGSSSIYSLLRDICSIPVWTGGIGFPGQCAARAMGRVGGVVVRSASAGDFLAAAAES